MVGYLRPVKQWNSGKQAEYEDRKTFNVRSDVADAQSMSADRGERLLNAECGKRNAESGMENAECGMGKVETKYMVS